MPVRESFEMTEKKLLADLRRAESLYNKAFARLLRHYEERGDDVPNLEPEPLEPMIQLLSALNRYAKAMNYSVATSAAVLLCTILEKSEHPDIALTDAMEQLTEYGYWLATADEILDGNLPPLPPSRPTDYDV
jgi:hypothetical protein